LAKFIYIMGFGKKSGADMKMEIGIEFKLERLVKAVQKILMSLGKESRIEIRPQREDVSMRRHWLQITCGT
jgi:intein/homing endonuclease